MGYLDNQVRLTLSVTTTSVEKALDLLVAAANDAKETNAKDAGGPNENKWVMWGHISSQKFSYLTLEPHRMTGPRENWAHPSCLPAEMTWD